MQHQNISTKARLAHLLSVCDFFLFVLFCFFVLFLLFPDKDTGVNNVQDHSAKDAKHGTSAYHISIHLHPPS